MEAGRPRSYASLQVRPQPGRIRVALLVVPGGDWARKRLVAEVLYDVAPLKGTDAIVEAVRRWIADVDAGRLGGLP